ncbi:MAG TPA: hypothetical protein VFJ19_19890 [Nocardioidaceae bacterium]|nr:hypothetical protein [Nocardioidaceae bacterium]
MREFVRSLVRAGLAEDAQVRAEATLAIRAELPDRAEDADALADTWLAEFRAELADEQRGWPQSTDYDRLQDAFAEIAAAGVVVLQGCEDHWAAKAELGRRDAEDRLPRGIAWFTPPDVWHAIDEGMLEVNLWHGSTANAAPGDPLLDEVVAVFEKHGLPAHFDEGRIEVSAHWHRRLGSTIET